MLQKIVAEKVAPLLLYRVFLLNQHGYPFDVKMQTQYFYFVLFFVKRLLFDSFLPKAKIQ